MAGTNWLSVSDGVNNHSIGVGISNGKTPPPSAFHVSSVNGSTVLSYSSCGYTEWDAGSSLTVDIIGGTNGPDGTGSYYDATGAKKTFTISNGSFTISDEPVYDGYNNLTFYDTAYNSMSMTIWTSNGQAKPKFMEITSPSHNGSASGLTTVSGSISNYAPTKIYAEAGVGVWNGQYCDYTYSYYSNDSYDQQNYGCKQLTFSAQTGSFSFNVDFGSSGSECYSYVYVSGWDDVNYISHSHSIYVNNIYGYGEYWSKPGSKQNAVKQNIPDSRKIAEQAGFIRWINSRMAGH